jgi:hypothetical protein
MTLFAGKESDPGQRGVGGEGDENPNRAVAPPGSTASPPKSNGA